MRFPRVQFSRPASKASHGFAGALRAGARWLPTLGLLGPLWVGCDQRPAAPVREIKSLHMGGVYAAAAQTLATEFERQTGIHVTILGATLTSLREKELTDVLTHGGNFDVMQVPYQWEGEILPHLRPLDDVLARIAPDLQDFIPSVRTNCGQWDGHVYGLPMACDVITLLYRTDVFAARAEEFKRLTGDTLRPPTTWDEYLKIARFLNTESLYGNIIMGGDQIYTVWSGILYGLGGQPVDERLQPAFDSEAGVRSLDLFKEMFQFAPPQSERRGVEEANALFLQGRGAMYLTWPSLLWAHLRDTNACKVAGKIAAAVVPGGKPQLSSWSLGINPACKDFDAACRWTAFFINRSNNKRLLLEYGKGSPRLSTYADPECKARVFYLDQLLQGFAGAQSRLRIPPSQELSEYLDQELIKAVQGQHTPRVALERVTARWREILSRAGYLGQ